jgi:hypothetical protein
MLNEAVAAVKLARAMAPTTIGRPSSIAMGEAEVQAAEQSAAVMPFVAFVGATVLTSLVVYSVAKQ